MSMGPRRPAVLAELQGMPARRASLDDAERLLLDRARDEGITWREIAAALGLDSPQAAHKRHATLTAKASNRRATYWPSACY